MEDPTTLPVATKDLAMPFLSDSLSPRDFERLCAMVLESRLEIAFKLYGISGEKQHGIDLAGRHSGSEVYTVVQCKEVAKFSVSDLLAELEKVETLPLEVDVLYFAVGSDVSAAVSNELAEREPHIRTAKGPVARSEIIDAAILSRWVQEDPRLVSSFFGKAWSEHLYPGLGETKLDSTLATEVSSTLKSLQDRPSVFEAKWEEEASSFESPGEGIYWSDTINDGAEGYFPRSGSGPTFHGYGSVEDSFSFRYQLSVAGPDSESRPIRTMIACAITPEEAIDLEVVLYLDHRATASVSTYYSRTVYLTHIQGPNPIISFTARGLALMLASPGSLDRLRLLVGSYLDAHDDPGLAHRRLRSFEAVADVDLSNMSSSVFSSWRVSLD